VEKNKQGWSQLADVWAGKTRPCQAGTSQFVAHRLDLQRQKKITYSALSDRHPFAWPPPHFLGWPERCCAVLPRHDQHRQTRRQKVTETQGRGQEEIQGSRPNPRWGPFVFRFRLITRSLRLRSAILPPSCARPARAAGCDTVGCDSYVISRNSSGGFRARMCCTAVIFAMFLLLFSNTVYLWLVLDG
jgi:hypothetical protein